tara:strand:- start:428 stop:1432 length:1005 start_codon:yes stop_codon:yes gene_type:complete
VLWDARSLARFNDEPLEELVNHYDLVVIDHPFVGRASSSNLLIPVDDLVDRDTLIDAVENSVGVSHRAYQSDGRYWAVDIDTAAHVSVHRRDLLPDSDVPQEWADVLELIYSNPGRVALPLAPVDAFCCAMSLASWRGMPVALGNLSGLTDAVDLLLQALPALHPSSLELTPPKLLQTMSETNEIIYAPLTFGYAIASRTDARLRFRDAPFGDGAGGPLLGGSGLAVSSRVRDTEAVGDFVRALVAPWSQRELAAAGGQPPAREVWDSPRFNASTNDFFIGTRKSVDEAYVRPRDPHWPDFQAGGSTVVHGALTGNQRLPVLDSLIELEERLTE